MVWRKPIYLEREKTAVNFPPHKKVSVVIPTYNRAQFLPNAVKSIIDQKYNETEIIIVDDGSSDNTQDVVNSIKKNYSNIIYCNNERSKGPSGARNTGIIKSTGQYLAFLDSDDVWLDGHVKNGLEVFNNNPEVDVLFGNFNGVDYKTGHHLYNFFDQKKILPSLNAEKISPGTYILKDNLFTALIQENFFLLGGVIVKKSVVERILFDEAIMFAEDRDFGIQLYKNAKASFAYREDPLYISYKHDTNIYKSVMSNDESPIIEAHIYLFIKYLRELRLSKIEIKILKKLIAKKHSELAYSKGRKKEYKEAMQLIIRSFHFAVTLDQILNAMKLLFITLPFTRNYLSYYRALRKK